MVGYSEHILSNAVPILEQHFSLVVLGSLFLDEEMEEQRNRATHSRSQSWEMAESMLYSMNQ